MNFREFEAEALRVWAEIPEKFKEGIDGIQIRREHLLERGYDDYYTLGTCSTEPYPSDYQGPETARSVVNLYYGSFQKVAHDDPDFPWEEEIHETILHELRHHLEYLAGDDETDELDHAMEETYRREEGFPYDPWYFQFGVPVREGYFEVERDLYIEVRWRDGEGGRPRWVGGGGAIEFGAVGVRGDSGGGGTIGADSGEEGEVGAALGGNRDRAGPRIEFDFEGARWTIPWPDDPGELHYLEVLNLGSEGGILEVVLVKEIGFGGTLRRFFLRTPPVLLESQVHAVRVGEARASGERGERGEVGEP